jgi:hypothetical protein
MALSQPMQLVDNFQQAIDFESVYIKVSSIRGDKNLIQVVVDLMAGPDGIVFESSNKSFAPNLDGPNFIKQAYQYLKTLPEFSDAEDC